MTDMTSNAPAQTTPGRKRTGEFHVYFALIFILAMPFATERWISHIIRKRSLDVRGPMARAWAEADRITPLIFSR